MFEENSLIGQIAKGIYPTEKVTTQLGSFTLKYPSGKDRQVMARKKAVWLGGLDVSKFDINDKFAAEIDATLSVAITEYPPKYPDEWKGDDIVDMPIEEVKNALYKAFNIFYRKIQDQLSGSGK